MEKLLNIVLNVLIIINNLNVLNVKKVLPLMLVGYIKLDILYMPILNVKNVLKIVENVKL